MLLLVLLVIVWNTQAFATNTYNHSDRTDGIFSVSFYLIVVFEFMVIFFTFQKINGNMKKTGTFYFGVTLKLQASKSFALYAYIYFALILVCWFASIYFFLFFLLCVNKCYNLLNSIMLWALSSTGYIAPYILIQK